MWIIKSKIEIAEDINKKRKDIKSPILFGILSLLFLLLNSKVTYEKFKANWQIKPWSEVFESFPIFIIMAIFVAIGTYIHRYFFKDFRKTDAYICIVCEKTATTDSINCSCGNNFVPIDTVKWVQKTQTIIK